jgi:asparagine synthase (glutamine-hydrolysing)
MLFGIVASEERRVSVQAGIWNLDGKPVDTDLIADFSTSLSQQGPDGQFYSVDGSMALLYRPFHTTAESRREKQPYTTRRAFVLTWDGRLDNRNELMLELQSNCEVDSPDVAVVGAAFDRWETDCFRRIIGDWAVAVWKPQQRELIFAIDYMATRHIFYYLKRNAIWWSTDLSPLVLLSGDKFQVDDDYICGYFANDPDAHLTPYREIREVPPGHLVRLRNGSVSADRHWRFDPNSRIRYKADKEYEEHFRHLFRQAVRRRLRSDSPILAALSGGLDSSSIVCMADDILAKEGAQAPRIDTLTNYDMTEPGGDDWIYYQKIEEKRGRVGSHIDASSSGMPCASQEYYGFEPLPGCVPSGRRLEAERADVIRRGGYRTVLSGIGGDEFLGGIPNPSAHLADLIVQFKFFRLVHQLTAWSLIKRRPGIQLLGQALSELLPVSLRQYLFTQVDIEPWIKKEFAKRTRLAVRLLDVGDHFGLWLPTRRSYIGGVLLMANKLAKFTSPTLAHEEMRFPYLDQTLIEFILSIPADQLLRPGERRSLMRRSLVSIVPDEILSRKTKQFGVRTPVVAMEKNLQQLQLVFESALSSEFGYVDGALFLEKLHAAKNGKAIHISRMLRTISLELWLRDLASRHLIDFAATHIPNVSVLSMQANV